MPHDQTIMGQEPNGHYIISKSHTWPIHVAIEMYTFTCGWEIFYLFYNI